MKRRVQVALAVSALLGASQAMAAAADWEVLPFGSLGSYYESNLGLSPVSGDKLDVLGAEATAGVALRATSPVSTFILRPYARSTWFPSEKDSDYNNAYLDLDYKRRGQRSNLSLLGNFAHETVTSRALDVTTPQGDLGNPTDGDVSNAGTRSRRDLVGVYPMASFSITQRNRLDLAINWVDVNYDRELPGQELGYGFSRGAVGWGFSISQLDSVTLTAAADKFDPDDLQGQPPSIGSRTNSLTARWMRSLNETQRWYVQAGANRTRFELAQGATDRITKSGYSGGAGASWKREKSQLFVDLVYRVQPSSSGVISNQTDGRLRLVRNFTPRWAGTIAARYVRSQAVDKTTTTDYRDYGNFNVGAEWRWSRKLSLKGELAYIRQKLENQPSAGDSQMVTLSFAYDAGRTD